MLADPEADPAAEAEDEAVADERLRLIFTCCHPALPLEARVALTLRTLGGLTTPEIARAFLTAKSTMAQRLVRAKRKIKDAGIPYRVPDQELLGERVSGVLAVLYLIFNEAYSASTGPELTRVDLGREAIRLTRMLVGQMSDEPEALGLLALMLYHDSRRLTRTDGNGSLLLLEEQDRTRWDRSLIREANAVFERAIEGGAPGPYQLQAAIAGLHANAPTPAHTDWRHVAACYDRLAEIAPTPVVALNGVVAHAMADGPERGLELLGGIRELDGYHLFHATRADLLRRLGRNAQAAEAYERALDLSENDAERTFLERRLAQLPTR